jgi:hypothetical protein
MDCMEHIKDPCPLMDIDPVGDHVRCIGSRRIEPGDMDGKMVHTVTFSIPRQVSEIYVWPKCDDSGAQFWVISFLT